MKYVTYNGPSPDDPSVNELHVALPDNGGEVTLRRGVSDQVNDQLAQAAAAIPNENVEVGDSPPDTDIRFASPAAKEKAEDLGVDLSAATPSSDKGFTAADVEQVAAAQAQREAAES